jgi:hypothetical protein
MGLKLKLHRFNKTTEFCEGEFYSQDFGDDGAVIESLGLRPANTVNQGVFNVLPEWVALIQPYFNHTIDLSAHDYQLGFAYRDQW